MKPETLCTGCGATVTVQFGMLRDSFASPYCIGTTKFHTINETELPPVAIKPEAAPQWKANKIVYPRKRDVSFEVLDENGDTVCQTIMREVVTEKERIATDAQRIKMFAAAPAMLDALKVASMKISIVLPGFPVNGEASLSRRNSLEYALRQIDAAIAKAEAVQA